MEDALQILLDLGFEEAGEWLASQATLKYSLVRHAAESHILYAFVSHGQVLYVGKSVRTLSQRMYNYQNPGPTQSTNIINHANIRQVLEQGATVQIFAFAPKEQFNYRGIPVSLAAGLEDTLIARINPAWNRTGNAASGQGTRKVLARPSVGQTQRRNLQMKPNYEALEVYLRSLPKDTSEVTLAFAKVQSIVGGTLPVSHLNYRQWWANPVDTSRHAQARAWTNAGFKVEEVYQGSSGWVKFARR